MFRKLLLALGALFAANAFASPFSIYFNGESATANCHVDGVSNAYLSTGGNGNLVATATIPLAFSSACGISGTAQQLTFGPAQPLKGPASTLATGTNVPGGFTVLPWNAASCAVAITTTSGTGTATGPTSGYVCGPTGTQSCAASTPIAFNGTFTNTGTTNSTYLATVTCQAASGASPASLTSSTTVTQSGNSGGTPAANFTFVATGLAVNFTDTSTDPGGTINAWSWNFGETGSASNTSTLQHPSHTYAAAGTYTVSLTVTDSLNATTSTKTQSVTVSAAASCATIASSTPGITNFTQLTGNQNVYYFGSGAGTGNQPIDVTSYASFWFGTWPGQNGRSGYLSVPTNKYMSQAFTVPAGYFAGKPANIYGQIDVGTSSNDAAISMTISKNCGDFSNPSQAGSSVLPGCWINNASSGGMIQWSKTAGAGCNPADGQSYYWNFINADISGVTPTGGSAAPNVLNPNLVSTCGPSSCKMSLYTKGNF